MLLDELLGELEEEESTESPARSLWTHYDHMSHVAAETLFMWLLKQL